MTLHKIIIYSRLDSQVYDPPHVPLEKVSQISPNQYFLKGYDNLACIRFENDWEKANYGFKKTYFSKYMYFCNTSTSKQKSLSYPNSGSAPLRARSLMPYSLHYKFWQTVNNFNQFSISMLNLHVATYCDKKYRSQGVENP